MHFNDTSSNAKVRHHYFLFAPASPLLDKTPVERAKVLATTPLFAHIHAETAESGQSAAVIDTDLHFTCFVAATDNAVRLAAQGVPLGEGVTQEDLEALPKRLIELDGRRAGPVDHGECTDLLTVRHNAFTRIILK